MDAVAWVVLTVASVIAVLVILDLNEGTTFFFDELIWFSDLGARSGPDAILHPHNSHLHGTTRATYLVIHELFGTDYGIVRALGAAAVVAASVSFFALVRLRVGAPLAAPLAVLLLFYGSAWSHVVVPIGFTVLLSVALGLLALLALEADSRRRDLAACALVTASVFTFTVGLGYLVGVAIIVLLRADRWRRAWIWAVPLGLYTSWWLWALQFDQGRTEAANVTAIPSFFGESLALVLQALVGLKGNEDLHPSAVGWVLAAAFVALVGWRLSRGNVPRSLYASIGVVGTYWLAGALATGDVALGDEPGAPRYMFPGTVGVLLVATDAVRGLRVSKLAAPALAAVCAVGLLANVGHLKRGADFFRNYSIGARTSLAMLELGSNATPGAEAGEGPAPEIPAERVAYLGPFGPDPPDYLDAARRYGSPAFTLDEVRAQSATARAQADAALLITRPIRLEPASQPPSGPCERGLQIELDPGASYVVRGRGASRQAVSLSRFGDGPGIEVGTLSGSLPATLALPADEAEDPWRATASAGELVACRSS